MGMRLDDIDIAARVNPQRAEDVRRRLLSYMSSTDLTTREVANRIGYGRSTLNFFIRADYSKVVGDERYLCAALWEMMERNPICVPAGAQARLFPTENYRRIKKYFEAAAARGEVCLLYSPPGTQKSFVLEYLVAERNQKKLNDAIYIYASCNMAPLALLKRIGQQAGAPIKTPVIEGMLTRLLALFSSLSAERGKPPAIIVDEAQHLRSEALEFLRELHDRSGCGLVLAGSHDLFEKLLRGRAQLEQWLSRIDHKDPLPGLQENEVQEIAVRELGNGRPAKLAERQVDALVRACRVDDVFARGSDGKPAAVKYLSVRRLVKVLAQHIAKREAA